MNKNVDEDSSEFEYAIFWGWARCFGLNISDSVSLKIVDGSVTYLGTTKVPSRCALLHFSLAKMHLFGSDMVDTSVVTFNGIDVVDTFIGSDVVDIWVVMNLIYR